MDSKLLSDNKTGIQAPNSIESPEENKMDTLNIGEIEKQNEQLSNQPDNEKIKKRNVKFIKTEPDFDEDLSYFAVDKDGQVYPDLESVQKKLKEDGAVLFVYSYKEITDPDTQKTSNVFTESPFPYAYMNNKGQLSKSDEPVSSVNQMPGSKFTPMKSPLVEDIVKQGDANLDNKAADLHSDAAKFLKKEKERRTSLKSRVTSLSNEIRTLERKVQKINDLPKEPALPGGIVKQVEPTKPTVPIVPVEPIKPVAPVKPEIGMPKDRMPKMPERPKEPIEPVKPATLANIKKPAVLVDLEETKNLHPLSEPKLVTPVDPGAAPGYSRISQILARIFLRRDSVAYTKKLQHDRKVLEYRQALREFPAKEEKYKRDLKAYNDRNTLLEQRRETIEYLSAVEATQKEYNEKQKEYETQFKKYQEELKKYEADLKKYNEESAKYEEEQKNYDNKTMNMDEQRDLTIKENNAYVDAMKEYTDAAEKYDAEMEKYEAEYEKFKVKLAEYEKEAQEYDIKSKEYEEKLLIYEAELKKYNEALDAYPGGREAFEAQMKEFTERLKDAKITLDEYHNLPGELEKKKQTLENVKEEQKIFENKVSKTRAEMEDLVENKENETAGLEGNKKKVEAYRDHLEVKLEGISDLLENNRITRKNLFAMTWMLKSGCHNKRVDDPVAREKLFQYLACKQAEKNILANTKDYKLANPETEVSMIRNLNNNQAADMLKKDPLLNYILDSVKGKNINADMIEKAFFDPSPDLKNMVQRREERKDLNEIIKGIEEKFGKKPIDDSCFKDFVMWKTYKDVLNVFGNTDDFKKMITFIRIDYETNPDILSAQGKMAVFYKKTMDTYQDSFNEVIKNQKAKEEAVKDMPESTKRLMRLKVDYTMKELGDTVIKHKANVAEAKKAEAKKNSQPGEQKAVQPGEQKSNQPKVMAGP